MTVPKGTIVAFYSADPVPPGWAICDGSPGRPDLTGLFIMGTKILADVNITPQVPSHTHKVSGTSATFSGVTNSNVQQNDGQPLSVPGTDHRHSISFDSGPSDSIPPHIVLLYIIKITDD
jgi:hypothetical protein